MRISPERAGAFVLRVCLGAVFLSFGIGKFQNDVWAQTMRTMGFFLKLPWKPEISVMLVGGMEVVTGAALVTGLYTRVFAGLAAVQLGMILILLGFQETRDIGLWGAAMFLAVHKEEKEAGK